MNKAQRLMGLCESEGIYQQLKDAGVPLDSHESDLYAKVTPESTEIIKNYRFKSNVKKFIDNINHEEWYDIPFAYEPFWDKKQKNAPPPQSNQYADLKGNRGENK